MMTNPPPVGRWPLAEPGWLLLFVLGSSLLLGINPQADRLTWVMETIPVWIGSAILLYTHPRWSLTRLTYRLLVVISLVLMIGGYYTYAKVPLFDWIAELFELQRNHYDRLAHLIQGFVPVMLVREILVRWSPLRSGGWLFFLSTAVALAISAFYELIEWWAAIFTEGGAIDFLGTQGDLWDTQWDMFLALNGALLAQWLLSAHQDRQLAAMGVEPLGHLRDR